MVERKKNFELIGRWILPGYMAQLRKRLGNAGIDLNNPRVNESFVLVRLD